MKKAYAIRPYSNQVILPQRAFKRGLERSLPQPLDLYITKGEAHPRPCQMTRPPRSDRLASALAYAIRPYANTQIAAIRLIRIRRGVWHTPSS
ncbi:MAG TPA: hypothetical protein VF326_05535 [Anaerolineaceae bacterium]